MRRRALALALVAVLAPAITACSGGGLGDQGSVTSVVPASQRREAPTISVPNLAGGPRVTLAALRGHPVVVNFWASWCEPCKKETPQVVAFAKSHPSVDVVGIAVNDRPADSRRFARKEGVRYTLGSDPEADVASAYGVKALPVTVVVDSEGRVAKTIFGATDAKQLAALTSALG
jgi:cytochrome c biogenesis protein CcmG, thiol:disulfide interchange protein DsbE